MSIIEEKLARLGLELPELPPYTGAFLPGVIVGDVVYLSAQAWSQNGRPVVQGAVGQDVDIETAAEAARHCMLNALAAARLLLGSLDNITQIIRLSGYVQSAPGFDKQSTVLNAASELLVELFGESGRHTRTSLGVNGLTGNASVLVELTLQRKP
jgi:enamine deaminase RidA (YjgF/YER057c/UK114 family)